MEQQHSAAANSSSKQQPTQPHPPSQQHQQQEQADGEDPSRIWLPEVVHHVARFLSSNERACTLRLVSKATAAQFEAPQHTTVRLSLPVPHHAFVRRWGSPGATRSLTVRQQLQLPRLTARSGSIANLEVLLARGDLTSPLDRAVMQAAAGTGQLGVCRWLRQQGCPLTGGALGAAAESGHIEVCAWLLAEGCPRCRNAMEKAASGGHRAVCECFLASRYKVNPVAAHAAARGGHVGLMDWLLARSTPRTHVRRPDIFYVSRLLQSAAAGCDLPALQRLHQDYLVPWGTELWITERERTVEAAAGSPTADWRDKVEWLEGQGFPRAGGSCAEAAQQLDGRERLEWLQRQGYPLTAAAAEAAVQRGKLDALEFLLGQGVQLDAVIGHAVVDSAARGGHLAILKVLHAHSYGRFMHSTTVAAAAGSGHLAVVAWLVEVLGAKKVALTTEVFDEAARSGSAELLAWLHERGCPWGASVFNAAARAGSEEQLEWLAERGCPMPDDGSPYRAVLQTGPDLAVLRCLRRLGCPWGPASHTFPFAVQVCGDEPRSTRPVRRTQLLLAFAWLLEQGCPVDWALAEAVAEVEGDGEVLARLRQLRAEQP